MHCKKYLIYGNVQGVGFRWSTKSFAEKLKVDGTVRNLPDGSVEIIVCGDAWQLEQFEAWLNAGGPRLSNVQKIETQEFDPEELPIGFTII